MDQQRGSGRPIEVALLAFPEATASVLFGLYDLFKSTGRDWGLVVDGVPGESLITPRLVAAGIEPFQVANGIRIQPETTIERAGTPDIVCVPELFLPPSEPLDGRFDAEIAWLRACHAGGATIAAACSGAMLLAQAGLLDGRDATTHWAYCDALERRHPRVTVHRQRSLVVAGEGQRLVMAGGGTSWQDLGLYLVARFVRIDAAMQLARLFLIDWHDAGQQPYARLAASRQSADAVIVRCQLWVADHYRQPAPVAAMTRLAGLPPAQYRRRFGGLRRTLQQAAAKADPMRSGFARPAPPQSPAALSSAGGSRRSR